MDLKQFCKSQWRLKDSPRYIYTKIFSSFNKTLLVSSVFDSQGTQNGLRINRMYVFIPQYFKALAHIYISLTSNECPAAWLSGSLPNDKEISGSFPIFPWDYCYIDWSISMLLVSRPELVEENTFEVFQHYDFHLCPSFM